MTLDPPGLRAETVRSLEGGGQVRRDDLDSSASFVNAELEVIFHTF